MRLSISFILLLLLNQTHAQFGSSKVQTMAMGLFTPIMSNGEQDTIAILIQDNIHIFKITTHSVTYISGENDLSNERKKEETLLKKYFAFNKISGLGYEVIGGDFQNKFHLDSFLTQRLPQFTSDSSLKIENYIYLKDSTNEYDLIETYLSKSTEKYKYPDSTILYYNSKFQDLEYGLNIRKEKQAQINKKLQKLKLVYFIDEKDLKEKATSNQMILSFELMDLPKKDLDPLLKIAEKAKKYFNIINN
jgi:hypothetical protein